MKKYIIILVVTLILLLIFTFFRLYIDYSTQIFTYRKIPDFTRWILSDKYIAKKYSELYGFDVIKTYKLVKYLNEIDFKSLPDNFVIKPTDLCDSEGVYLIKNKINLKNNVEFDKENSKDIDRLIVDLSTLKINIGEQCYMHELMYDGMIPFSGYIVEELLLTYEGSVPCDYKCYTFNGRIFLIAVTFNRKIINNKQCFDSVWMTRDWEPINITMIKQNYKFKILPKPKEYNKLIYLVENMSLHLKRHCRIDVYCLNNKVYLGEYTFFCGAWLHTYICNLLLGVKWLLNKDDYNYIDPKLKSIIPDYYNKVI